MDGVTVLIVEATAVSLAWELLNHTDKTTALGTTTKYLGSIKVLNFESQIHHIMASAGVDDLYSRY